jgi:hypothetical protein
MRNTRRRHPARPRHCPALADKDPGWRSGHRLQSRAREGCSDSSQLFRSDHRVSWRRFAALFIRCGDHGPERRDSPLPCGRARVERLGEERTARARIALHRDQRRRSWSHRRGGFNRGRDPNGSGRRIIQYGDLSRRRRIIHSQAASMAAPPRIAMARPAPPHPPSVLRRRARC